VGQSPSAKSDAKVLVVGILPYLFSARVAKGLAECGFVVEVMAPPNHPLRLLRSRPQQHDFGFFGSASWGPWGGSASLAAAIARARPDRVIPCDDLAMALLHRLGRNGAPVVRDVVVASLGPCASFDTLESRTAQSQLAQRLGVRVPPTIAVDSEAALERALADLSYPLMVKRDGTCAGQGVVKAYDADQARDAWADFNKMHSIAGAAAQVRARGWRTGLAAFRNTRSVTHVQQCIDGRPAHVVALCREGAVLHMAAMEAVATTAVTGPASVVRGCANTEVRDTAVRLAQSLGASGLLGFDFIVTPSGRAYFLEINARATPTSALVCRDGADLLGAMYQDVTGAPPRPRKMIAADTVAFFPHEIGRDPRSPYLAHGHHDIPEDEPDLVAFGLSTIGAEAASAARQYCTAFPQPVAAGQSK
jgi:hypothetical protein